MENSDITTDLDQDIESIQAVVCDLNGILRGKRVPVSQIDKVMGGGIRMPLSIVGVDVWGEDIVGSEQVFIHGDNDGICEPTGRGVVPVRWLRRNDADQPGRPSLLAGSAPRRLPLTATAHRGRSRTREDRTRPCPPCVSPS